MGPTGIPQQPHLVFINKGERLGIATLVGIGHLKELLAVGKEENQAGGQ